jgi:hypothetical protein
MRTMVRTRSAGRCMPAAAPRCFNERDLFLPHLPLSLSLPRSLSHSPSLFSLHISLSLFSSLLSPYISFDLFHLSIHLPPLLFSLPLAFCKAKGKRIPFERTSTWWSSFWGAHLSRGGLLHERVLFTLSLIGPGGILQFLRHCDHHSYPFPFQPLPLNHATIVAVPRLRRLLMDGRNFPLAASHHLDSVSFLHDCHASAPGIPNDLPNCLSSNPGSSIPSKKCRSRQDLIQKTWGVRPHRLHQDKWGWGPPGFWGK